MVATLSSLLVCAAVAAAGPLVPRAADLNAAAVAESQQRDNGATRAFSNVQIKTSDGQCLFVDKLSGDFRENLIPVQIAACGSTDGQGWDVITKGKHVRDGNMIIVSTLTNGCLNFDDRRTAPNLFSCGGRADGGGDVTDSQLFPLATGGGPVILKALSGNARNLCLSANGKALAVDGCNGSGAQKFTFGGGAGNAAAPAAAAAGDTAKDDKKTAKGDKKTTAAAAQTAAPEAAAGNQQAGCTQGTRTVTVAADNKKGADKAAAPTDVAEQDDASSASAAAPAVTKAAKVNAGGGGGGGGNVKAIPNPTEPVPVSGAKGTFEPSAAAESQKKDNGATRTFTSVSIRAPNGQCLFINPTAGNFRQNLIPVQLVDCSGTPNEKFDIISKGVHNDADTNKAHANSVLIVSSLMNGCLSLDPRKVLNVHMFSCGGRADGAGKVTASQLFPNVGQESFALSPLGLKGKCAVPGDGKLVIGDCPTDGSQLFSIFK